jgi:putative ABC transport system permease protein
VAYLQIDPNAKVTFTEPDFGKYGQIKGLKSLAKVFRSSTASLQAGSKAISSDLVAIDTKTFGETTDLDAKYLKYDFRDYLNVLSRNSNAVLLSSNFRDKQGLKVGDTVTYSLSGGYFSGTLNAKVYGFFDYWPSYNPEKITILADESVQTSDNYMIVAHLSTIQEAVGIFPYEIWIDMDGDTDGFYDFANDEALKITKLGDASKMKEDITVEPLFQGTNGILTMSFITILLICAIGYVIYWMLSIRSRELLFGIFRAMGMTRGEIIKMLACEQAFTGLFGIAFGLIVGWIASVLYVPIIQIAYSAADRALPLELITKGTDVARLIVIIFIMFAACMGVLIRQVYNMKISQALKLGED